MESKIWLICAECGYSLSVYSEKELYDHDKCPLCQGRMVVDLNQGRKLKGDICEYCDHDCKGNRVGDACMNYVLKKENKEPTGDNFPIEQMKFVNSEIAEIAMIRKEKRPKITKEDVEDLVIELGLGKFNFEEKIR